jgi:protein-serine/threonine kinase
MNSQKGIRRVASAPNANKLLFKQQHNYPPPPPPPASTAHSLYHHSSKEVAGSVPAFGSPLHHQRKVFRRTYSSASIKVKQVEVGPSSFVKIRMLGKGDVGKVYMVKQKNTDKLFAMKGNQPKWKCPIYHFFLISFSCILL